MKNDKKLKLTPSKSKAQWWRMGLILGLIFALGIINLGCCKENDEIVDEYYVKYEVNSSTIHSQGKLDVTINTENNTAMNFSISQRVLWETIIGPVQKGFIATMGVSSPYYELEIYTNIYVSKNDSPFALKKSDGSNTPRDNVQINYTIDY